LILALLLISFTVKELILRSEQKRGDRERAEWVTLPPALEMPGGSLPTSLAAPLASAPAEATGLAADLLALADAVPNEASAEVRPEPQSPQSQPQYNQPQYNQPQYNQPQYNQEDARVE
jgi:hypothetical protein